MDTQSSVINRYSGAAKDYEPALCCPITYDARYLKVIPEEVIEKDYGCGDPSRYVESGDTVLDLGAGAGKICFIASQVVGETGRVIGVDMTDDMLEVARRNAPIVANEIGYANVEFLKGRIQDLQLDLDLLGAHLAQHSVGDIASYLGLENTVSELRAKQPLVVNQSVDVVISNCVLNLVGPNDKQRLFNEIYRVLRPNGRSVISDIVCDQPVPQDMQDDPQLWSGCISGAMQRDEFLQAFRDAGFADVEVLELTDTPWQTVNGIDFRSMTVRAYKGEIKESSLCGTSCC